MSFSLFFLVALSSNMSGLDPLPWSCCSRPDSNLGRFEKRVVRSAPASDGLCFTAFFVQFCIFPTDFSSRFVLAEYIEIFTKLSGALATNSVAWKIGFAKVTTRPFVVVLLRPSPPSFLPPPPSLPFFHPLHLPFLSNPLPFTSLHFPTLSLQPTSSPTSNLPNLPPSNLTPFLPSFLPSLSRHDLPYPSHHSPPPRSFLRPCWYRPQEATKLPSKIFDLPRCRCHHPSFLPCHDSNPPSHLGRRCSCFDSSQRYRRRRQQRSCFWSWAVDSQGLFPPFFRFSREEDLRRADPSFFRLSFLRKPWSATLSSTRSPSIPLMILPTELLSESLSLRLLALEKKQKDASPNKRGEKLNEQRAFPPSPCFVPYEIALC